MPRYFWIGLAIVILVSVNALVTRRLHGEDAPPTLGDEARARETKDLSKQLRISRYQGRTYDYVSGIGGFAQSRYWKKRLPLADVQANAIVKLDKLAWDARIQSFDADADHLDGNPADYREYMKRSKARRRDALEHASSMVVYGFLTEPQAAFVTQIKLSVPLYVPNVLRDSKYVQEQLGITEKQREMLVQAGKRGRQARAQFNWFSADAKDQQAVYTAAEATQQATHAAAEQILTQQQRETLARLSAMRTLPAAPPNLPAFSSAEAAKIKLEELSPVFRVLARESNALELSAGQKNHLKQLEEVSRVGIWLIGVKDREEKAVSGNSGKQEGDRVEQTRKKFLRHAERVALLGILTERQAEHVGRLLKKSSSREAPSAHMAYRHP